MLQLGIKTTMNADFTPLTIRRMLMNPIYIGSIVYGNTRQLSVIDNGRRVKRIERSTNAYTCQNAHPAIVDEITFQRVQNRMQEAKHAAPVNISYDLRNPLTGLLRCSECGKVMRAKHGGLYQNGSRRIVVRCETYGCPTTSIDIKTVESAIMEILRAWCADYANVPPAQQKEPNEERISALTKQLRTIDKRLKRARELVELETYTPAEYLEQKNTLTVQRETIQAQLIEAQRPQTQKTIADILPEVQTVLDTYKLATTADQKNTLLNSIIERIIYHKTGRAKRGENPAELLTLEIFPRLSK